LFLPPHPLYLLLHRGDTLTVAMEIPRPPTTTMS
jgi:hypothetical protein